LRQKIIYYFKNLICPVGVTSVEYALIIVFIAAVIIIVVAALGGVVRDLFDIPPF